MGNKRIQLLADFALVFVTAVWGATFVSVKEAINHIEPFYFLAIRFGLATLIMLLVANKRLVRINASLFWKGSLIGIVLFAGYSFQTFGLRFTTASNAGFITGLSVVIVPIMVTAFQRKSPGLIPSLGILSATAGLGFLTINESLSFNYGDMLVFFCALSYAVHILLVGKYSPENDAVLLSTIQIATVAIASFVAALFKETSPTAASFNAQVWQAILVTAVFATAMAFFLQTWTQKYTSPTHTAIIFTMEPVFAALFAYLFGGESFTPHQGIGAILILSGMLATELGGSNESTHQTLKEIAEDNLKV